MKENKGHKIYLQRQGKVKKCNQVSSFKEEERHKKE